MENEKKNAVYVICRGYYCGVHAGYIEEAADADVG